MQPQSTLATPHGEEVGTAEVPAIHYTLPAGWEERPAGGMRVASFVIAGKDGPGAEVSVIPLSGVVGQDLMIFNMWRTNFDLPGVTEEQMQKQAEPVQIGDIPGKLFEVAREKPAANPSEPSRIIVAMTQKEGSSWFFKMSGADAVVREQKPAFVQFLKSVGFEEVSPLNARADRMTPFSANAKQAPKESSEKPVWVAPADWKEAAPGPMLLAKFQVEGKGGGRADVNIGTAGGGAGLNINRWRGQLGLSQMSPAEAEKAATPIEQGMLVDLKGTDQRTGRPARLLGVIVSQSNETWFYKLMGDEGVVEAQKEAFLKFVQSVKYRDAR